MSREPDLQITTIQFAPTKTRAEACELINLKDEVPIAFEDLPRDEYPWSVENVRHTSVVTMKGRISDLTLYSDRYKLRTGVYRVVLTHEERRQKYRPALEEEVGIGVTTVSEAIVAVREDRGVLRLFLNVDARFLVLLLYHDDDSLVIMPIEQKESNRHDL